MRWVASAIIIKNKHILLVKSERSWVLPGGKPESEESELECLQRELAEEIPGLEITGFRPFGNFSGQTPHSGDVREARAFWADYLPFENVQSGAEIKEIKWVGASEIDKLDISEISKKIIGSVVAGGYL